jgi:hypothetical protein
MKRLDVWFCAGGGAVPAGHWCSFGACRRIFTSSRALTEDECGTGQHASRLPGAGEWKVLSFQPRQAAEDATIDAGQPTHVVIHAVETCLFTPAMGEFAQ